MSPLSPMHQAKARAPRYGGTSFDTRTPDHPSRCVRRQTTVRHLAPRYRIIPPTTIPEKPTVDLTAKPIEPFYVMEILARARALESRGRDVIHLEIGEPDFPTPEPVIRRVSAFLGKGHVGYTPAGGLPELRAAIVAYYRDTCGIKLRPERIFVTPGASGAFVLLIGLLTRPGNQILLSDPGYPCYANVVRLFGGEPVRIPVGPGSNFHPTPEQFARAWTPHTIGTIVASPSNPTGTVIDGDTLSELSEICRVRGGFLISDEIYHGLEYGSPSQTALAFSDEDFVVNSFSKFFGMTGWRVGWAVVPERFVQAAEHHAQNLFISAPLPGQQGALAALSTECRAELERRRAAFAARRDFLLHGLTELGFIIPATPQGAFYIYADCSAHTADSHDFALRLLDQAGVAVTPGRDFGSNQPERYLRFAFTAPLGRLAEALTRLRTYLPEFARSC